jgi:hypothetical protein
MATGIPMRVNPILGMFSRLAARRLGRQMDLAPQRNDAAPVPVAVPAVGYWARSLFNPKRGTRWFQTMTRNVKKRPAKYKGTRIEPGEHGDHQEAAITRPKGRKTIEPIPSTDPLDLPIRPEPVTQRRTEGAVTSAVQAHLEERLARKLAQAAPNSPAALQARRERARLTLFMLRQEKKLARMAGTPESSFA